jgi:hypothetical protein
MSRFLQSVPKGIPVFLRFRRRLPAYGNSIDGLAKDVSYVILEQTDKKRGDRMQMVLSSNCPEQIRPGKVFS